MAIKSKKFKTLMAGLLLSIFTIVPAKAATAATYTVESGDSLYKIGKLFNIPYTSIMKDNNLSNSAIYPGQKLNLNVKTYTIKSGDSLFLISKANNISLDDLRKANNKWDNMIYPGDVLLIPSSYNTVNSSSTSVSKPRVNYTASDVDLMARLVSAEAEDQPYQAKVAVAAVVLNRVKSSEFPNTINDVIYERSNGYYQFTPVLNGWINRPASQESVNAVYEALNGSDPTNGALYYFDDTATNSWLWSKPVAIQIANMVFAY